MEEVDVDAPKTPPTPRRTAATTGAPIRRRGHQEKPGNDHALAPAIVGATNVAPPVAAPPPIVALPPAATVPPNAVLAAGAVRAGAAPNLVPSAAASTPIHDHESNPFIASPRAPQTPRGGSRSASPNTEQRYWAFSAAGSPHPRGTPRSGPHSPARRSPHVLRAFKKADDVKTFFEESEDTRTCLFCKYVFALNLTI